MGPLSGPITTLRVVGREGFEPPKARRPAVLQTAAIVHSATYPLSLALFQLWLALSKSFELAP